VTFALVLAVIWLEYFSINSGISFLNVDI
jgi:hypothetical protein